MEQVFEQELLVAPSLSDCTGALGYHDAFSVFMDIASVHAQKLGVGLDDMARRDQFWLTVKTQVCFFERPGIMERVTVRTWPEAPGRLRGDRSYQILRGDDVLIAGKTEWAVLNTKTNQLVPMDGVYPKELSFDRGSACPEPFARIPDTFDSPVCGRYTVRSTDIDVGQHMNNTAYLRSILGFLSCGELHDRPIRRIDAAFRTPCYEGEVLEMQRREFDAGLDVRLSKGSVTALLARIVRD